MAREMVTVRQLDDDGNLVAEHHRELMVRRPRNKAAYAMMNSSTRRNLFSDNPPTVETRPPRVVQPVNLGALLRETVEAAKRDGVGVRIVARFDD